MMLLWFFDLFCFMWFLEFELEIMYEFVVERSCLLSLLVLLINCKVWIFVFMFWELVSFERMGMSLSRIVVCNVGSVDELYGKLIVLNCGWWCFCGVGMCYFECFGLRLLGVMNLGGEFLICFEVENIDLEKKKFGLSFLIVNFVLCFLFVLLIFVIIWLLFCFMMYWVILVWLWIINCGCLLMMLMVRWGFWCLFCRIKLGFFGLIFILIWGFLVLLYIIICECVVFFMILIVGCWFFFSNKSVVDFLLFIVWSCGLFKELIRVSFVCCLFEWRKMWLFGIFIVKFVVCLFLMK